MDEFKKSENKLAARLAEIERRMASLEPDAAQIVQLTEAIHTTKMELNQTSSARNVCKQEDLARRRRKLNEPLSQFSH